ncbi:MAG TPA: (2Fe-2S)-binding protein [Jatrophihabitantaceae bacterium]
MNPYFALETPSSLSGWTALSVLADPAVLHERVARTRAALGVGPLRAAASVNFLGVASRVISPALPALVDSGVTPVLSLDTVWWRDAVPGPMRLAVTASSTSSSLVDAVVAPVLIPLLDAYATTFALSPMVLWGNMASAINGAAMQLGAASVAAGVLSAPPFEGTAQSLPPRFRRNSCCLLYRFAGAGMCGDCVLP